MMRRRQPLPETSSGSLSVPIPNAQSNTESSEAESESTNDPEIPGEEPLQDVKAQQKRWEEQHRLDYPSDNPMVQQIIASQADAYTASLPEAHPAGYPGIHSDQFNWP